MLDDLDREIITFLQYDGRMPFTQIATELGITEENGQSRILFGWPTLPPSIGQFMHL